LATFFFTPIRKNAPRFPARQQMQQHQDSSGTKESRFRAARGTHHSRRQRSALGGFNFVQ